MDVEVDNTEDFAKEIRLVEIFEWNNENVDQLYEVEMRAHIDPWTRESIIGSMELPYNHTLALYHGDRIIGYSLYSVVAGESDLYTIGIMPEYQGFGLGHLLLHESLKRANEENSRQCFLEVRLSNAVAIHLYEYYGFQKISIRHHYYPATAFTPSEDAYVMQAFLDNLPPLPERVQKLYSHLIK